MNSYPDIIQPFYDASVTVGAEYAAENLDIEMEDVSYPEWLPDTLQINARWAFAEGNTRETAIKLLLDSASRRIMNGARDTVTMTAYDTPGARYARFTSPDSDCDFCKMLASRGAVYGNEKNAGGRGHRFHDGCHCVVVLQKPGQKSVVQPKISALESPEVEPVTVGGGE